MSNYAFSLWEDEDRFQKWFIHHSTDAPRDDCGADCKALSICELLHDSYDDTAACIASAPPTTIARKRTAKGKDSLAKKAMHRRQFPPDKHNSRVKDIPSRKAMLRREFLPEKQNSITEYILAKKAMHIKEFLHEKDNTKSKDNIILARKAMGRREFLTGKLNAIAKDILAKETMNSKELLAGNGASQSFCIIQISTLLLIPLFVLLA